MRGAEPGAAKTGRAGEGRGFGFARIMRMTSRSVVLELGGRMEAGKKGRQVGEVGG